MNKVAGQHAAVSIRDQSEMETVVDYLSSQKGYRPLVRGMIAGIYKATGLSKAPASMLTDLLGNRTAFRFPYDASAGVIGDILIADDVACVLMPGKERLVAAAFGGPAREERLKRLCSELEECAKTKLDGRAGSMQFDWVELRGKAAESLNGGGVAGAVGAGSTASDSPQASTGPDYDADDVRAVKCLANGVSRKFMVKLSQVGKMTGKDAQGFAPEDVVQKLIDLGLVAEEYLLTCRQDQRTICIVPKNDPGGMGSLRCGVCGRTFAEENRMVVYMLTEAGRKLITGSAWMYIWVTEMLLQTGVRKDRIRWCTGANGEEMGIAVNDFGTNLLIDLKDREFGLGDAYPFVMRVTHDGGSSGLIVTMEKVSGDARTFLKERKDSVAIQLLEGSENIEAGLRRIVDKLAISEMREMVNHISMQVGCDLWLAVDGWIKAAGQMQKAPAVPQSVEKPAEVAAAAAVPVASPFAASGAPATGPNAGPAK